jgi:uncharacterized membrane protein
MRPFGDISRLSEATALDRVASPLRDAAFSVLRSERVRDALHGVWLGHPLHPMLVQVPIGAFISSAVLDTVPGARRGADTLLGVGLAAGVPAAIAGWADFAVGHEEQQRVGVVHAGTNVAALACYATSLGLRFAGRRGGGAAASGLGAALLVAGGVLGGHMSYHQAMGANHAQGVPHVAPSDWTDLGPVEEFPRGQPAKGMAGDTGVLIVRSADG